MSSPEDSSSEDLVTVIQLRTLNLTEQVARQNVTLEKVIRDIHRLHQDLRSLERQHDKLVETLFEPVPTLEKLTEKLDSE